MIDSNKGEEFLKIVSECQKNDIKVILEFGIQSIIKKEFKSIDRQNNLVKIENALKLLNFFKIPN